MEILKELVRSSEPTSVALGYFDGVHRGHRAVIGEAVRTGRENGLLPTVFTLMQSPRTVLRGEKSNNIITLDEKLAAFEELGVEQVYLIDFTTIKDITAQSFVSEVIGGCFNARHIACGFNYHFGAGARGSGAQLEQMCSGSGISVLARPRITLGGSPVSSTRIRACIIAGEIPQANDMLGRLYGFSLPVVHGRQLGRSWGTPTMNQVFPAELVKPRFGVYASRVSIDGKSFCGVTNIGIKPTVGSDGVLIETWMPDYCGRELYGEAADVRLLEFIRGERKFPDIGALKEEIMRNGEQAKKIYEKMNKMQI